jgi:hypothetical protein
MPESSLGAQWSLVLAFTILACCHLLCSLLCTYHVDRKDFKSALMEVATDLLMQGGANCTVVEREHSFNSTGEVDLQKLMKTLIYWS